jgi:thymidylate synthase ThyX
VVQRQEEFTENQEKILEKFVTNTSGNIFALRNLPEVIKGALFSRYSRSSLGLRSLLLKEFILNEDTAFASITGLSKADLGSDQEQLIAIQKAQNFYDRILDGYGDDSIGELGGAHLAIENVSILAAKNIEDCRIGGAPLEKSTRYIYFDQKIKGEYLFYKEPILMASAYKDQYLKTCKLLFDTYSLLIPKLTSLIEQKFPKEHHISKPAYTTALRAKVLDCLRGLLPASVLTNVGLFGNGRFFEYLLQKLNSHNLTELQEIGKEAFTELSKIIPSFVRRADLSNKYYQSFFAFSQQMKEDIKLLAESHSDNIISETTPKVELVHFAPENLYRVIAALLYENMHVNLSDLEAYVKELPEEEIARILDAASLSRENRRHKSPRALEMAEFTFEIVADFGAFRDLQRHRLLTQERQLLTCNYGYFVPQEIIGTELEKEYCSAMDMAKITYDLIAKELPEEAQYVVPMAYHIRWFFHLNLRSLQWLSELRSSPAGHPNYRFIAQEMAKQVSKAIPQFERFFKFVDFDGYELGRLGQEMRKEQKKERL